MGNGIMHTILYDTETTGLLQPEAKGLQAQPYIIEFYGVRIDDDFKYILLFLLNFQNK